MFLATVLPTVLPKASSLWGAASMLLDLLWLAVLGYTVLQAVALTRLSGAARAAASVPLVVMVPIVIVTLVAVAQQSNLWPLLLLLASPLALVYLAVVLLVAGARGMPGGA
jgi:hypothetical protein